MQLRNDVTGGCWLCIVLCTHSGIYMLILEWMKRVGLNSIPWPVTGESVLR